MSSPWRYVGKLDPGQAWYHLPLPPCSECGGDLIWWEAGFVPGYRRCCGTPRPDGRYDLAGPSAGCGMLYRVSDGRRGGKVFVFRTGRRDRCVDIRYAAELERLRSAEHQQGKQNGG